MTHLEMLEEDLRAVEAEPNGKASLFALDLRGQIAAAKFQQEQMATSMRPERYFGATQASPQSSVPSEDDPMAPAMSHLEASLQALIKRKNPGGLPPEESITPESNAPV